MESALEVEYIPAVAPPSEEATGKHEDWVSAVDGSWGAAVATGCYDGTARLWTPGGVQMIQGIIPAGFSATGLRPRPRPPCACFRPPRAAQEVEAPAASSSPAATTASCAPGASRWTRRGASRRRSRTNSLFVGHEGA